jgi:Leucine-rich repeat (LRR) protein
LVNFNLRDNQLNSLPKSIKALQTLERLDLSNNNLSNLPAEMATIEPLKQILLAGNPLRAIRKDIVNRGTIAIIKHLRNQLTEIAAEENESNERMAKTDMLGIVKSTKVYDLSSKKLTAITSDMISFCQQCTAVAFNASRNQLTDLPDEYMITNTIIILIYVIISTLFLSKEWLY